MLRQDFVLMRGLGQIVERGANDTARADDERGLARAVLDEPAPRRPISTASAATLLTVEWRRNGERRTGTHDDGASSEMWRWCVMLDFGGAADSRSRLRYRFHNEPCVNRHALRELQSRGSLDLG